MNEDAGRFVDGNQVLVTKQDFEFAGRHERLRRKHPGMNQTKHVAMKKPGFESEAGLSCICNPAAMPRRQDAMRLL